MDKQVRWGIMSTAIIAREAVIPAMLKEPYRQSAVITAIASRELAKAQATAERFGIPQAYGSYEELLADEQVDAVYIPLPNHLHVPYAIQSLEAGKHVVLSFGEHESDLDYLLVSNLLTRKIRAAWEKKTNEFRTHGKAEPKPLIIVVEEAHKLLNREMAAQTTFATIARELRKYYVTLLIVDQRPSQIYDEVMSQLGTRISGWLGDDLDIQAVLSGLSGRDSLRGMLARLQPKEEVLLLGWGVPMPLPVRSRRYDEAFWKEMSGGKKSRQENLRELGFGG